MKTEPTAPAAASSSTFKNVKEVEANARTKMDKVLADLQHEVAQFRTGRANIGLLDSVRVDYFGTPTPLNQVAQLHVPEPALITVQPWDHSIINAIDKGIRIADLGLTVDFAAGESIHTENSYKYTPRKVAKLLRDTGFEPSVNWRDDERLFQVTLATVASK